MSLSQKAVLRLLICTLIGGALYGQQSIECTSPTYDPGPPSPTIRIGGRLKPSTGVLRVLVVFIRFNGDNETNSRWPNPSVMPDWAANIVDSDVSPTGNYTPGSLSHFFYENTYGSLHVVGSVYYVTTVHDEDYYHFLAGNVFYKRRVLTDEIFSTLDSAPYNVAFDEFDTWAANAEYDFTPDASDGSLDMCWLVTRNLHEANNPNGNNYPGYEFGTIIAQLWTSNTTFDGVTIGEGFGLSGSGISFFGIGPMYMPLHASEAQHGETHFIGTMAHEFSHYLLGDGHFGSMRGDGRMLSTRRSNGEFRPYSAHSGNCFGTFLGYEKYRLGWLTPTEITTDTTVTLHNFGTTTDPEKYKLLKVPIPGTDQFFLVENRQFISIFEPRNATFTPESGELRPGILIYHMIQEYDDFKTVRAQIRSAEGRHIWRFLQGEGTSTHDDDIIATDYSDFVNGYDEKERIYFAAKPPEEYWHAAWWNPDGIFFGYPSVTNYVDESTVAEDTGGDSLDVFQVGEVFTPWSNPGSHYWTGSTFAQTTFGIEITSFNPADKSYTLMVRLSNPEALAPSKPQDVQASYTSPTQVSVNWMANLEPDIRGYDVYRATYYEGGSLTYTKIAPSVIGDTTFTDDPPVPSGVPSGVDVYYRYHVLANDNTGKYSVPSEDYWLHAGRTVSGSISANTTWSGRNIVLASVTVNSGVTLTISPGATVILLAGTSLNAYGKLSAEGGSSSHILFTSTGSQSAGSWGTITLSGPGASNSSLSHVDILYGTKVAILNNASNVAIQNCEITAVAQGVDFNGSSGSVLNNEITSSTAYSGIVVENGSSVTCNENVLTKQAPNYQSGAAILYAYGSGGTLWKNDISGWNWGVGAIWGSSPHFMDTSNAWVNNRIDSCKYGVRATNSSWPVICPDLAYEFYYYAGNSIHNNSPYNLFFASGGTLWATLTYWGGTPPINFYTLYGSTINYDDWLTSDPWEGEGSQSLAMTNSSSLTSSALPSSQADVPGVASLFDGVALRLAGKYVEAMDFFRNYLAKNPDDQAAYVELYNCYSKETAADLLSYFTSLPQEASRDHGLLLGYLYMKQGDSRMAHQVNDELIKSNPSTALASRAKLNNAYLSLYADNDVATAALLLNEVASKPELTTDIELSLVQQAIEAQTAVLGGARSEAQEAVSPIEMQPTETELLQNYPNPFNPTTVIQYSVSEPQLVTLKVYDLLGREISVLANEMKQPGNYTVSFDASRLPTGVYFYHLTAGGRSIVKRMTVVK